jgi:hypothetical protein
MLWYQQGLPKLVNACVLILFVRSALVIQGHGEGSLHCLPF